MEDAAVNQHKDGGPAFPISIPGHGDNGAGGMTLRDYFAAAALQGICASQPGTHWTDDLIAGECYRLANAMLRARQS